MCTPAAACPTLPQAERYVCSVPRSRYSLLGHRAALVLATDAEAGDGFASFLKSATKEEEVRRCCLLALCACRRSLDTALRCPATCPALPLLILLILPAPTTPRC